MAEGTKACEGTKCCEGTKGAEGTKGVEGIKGPKRVAQKSIHPADGVDSARRQLSFADEGTTKPVAEGSAMNKRSPPSRVNIWFSEIAGWSAEAMGTAWAFAAATLSVIVWAVSGLFFHCRSV